MKSFNLCMTAIMLFASCQNIDNNKPTTVDPKAFHDSGIHNISVAKEGCHGPCPVQVLEFDRSLKVMFYGGILSELDSNKRKGHYVGTLTPPLWTQICSMVERANLSSYKDTYRGNEDFEGLELLITFKDSTKRIWGKIDSLPPAILQTRDSLFALLNKIQLDQVIDTLYFKTGNGIVR